MTVYQFNRAILRDPAPSVSSGLSAREDGEPPAFKIVLAEHHAYAEALAAAGVELVRLPALDAFPDSVFVEDPALVFTEAAILLRASAPTRQGEAQHLALVTPRTVFIGLSARTDRTGAEALARLLASIGREARVVETPAGVLHLKSASSLIDEDTILATPALAHSGFFDGMRILTVPEGDEGAANALRINHPLFIAAGHERTADMLAKAGFDLVPLRVDEIAKIDASLSCMSLRWFAAGGGRG
ncbi:MAG: dimethylarginine dimethylaminohydrolase [Alphaproteobacteria bacterium]|nr:MAG: dimethylarginine dimethylaminohydrolase [Alphaproteobacteria bacterium]